MKATLIYLSTALTGGTLLLASGCTSPPGAATGLGEDTEVRLAAMADLLQDADHIRYRGRDWNDVLLDDGHVVQAEGTFSVALTRPNRLRVHSVLGGDDITLWYDGKEVTVYERTRNLVAREAADAELDDFLDRLIEDGGFAIPGQEFLYADLVDELTEWVDAGRVIGTGSVGAEPSHHLAFSQDGIDWELWIDAGDQAVPRRLVIEETDSVQRFGYRAEFEDWAFDPVPGDTFAQDVPADAEAVPLEHFIERLEEVSP